MISYIPYEDSSNRTRLAGCDRALVPKIPDILTLEVGSSSCSRHAIQAHPFAVFATSSLLRSSHTQHLHLLPTHVRTTCSLCGNHLYSYAASIHEPASRTNRGARLRWVRVPLLLPLLLLLLLLLLLRRSIVQDQKGSPSVVYPVWFRWW